MKHKKLINIVLIIVSVILLALYMVRTDREMNETFPCHVVDQMDENYTDQVNVTFTGTYRDYLIRPDTFKGRIEIEGYEFLDTNAADVELTLIMNELSWVVEHITTYMTPSIRYIATFSGEEDFESFFLWLMIPDEEDPDHSQGRYFLTYPKMTKEYLNEILS